MGFLDKLQDFAFATKEIAIKTKCFTGFHAGDWKMLRATQNAFLSKFALIATNN